MKKPKYNMNEFKFYYGVEDDILSIYSQGYQTEETIEFSENLNIDIDKEGKVIGLEIFDASEFFNALNEQIDKGFLENLEEVSFKHKEFRNMWYIIIILKAKGKEIQQPMPLLRKSDYVSPLIASSM